MMLKATTLLLAATFPVAFGGDEDDRINAFFEEMFQEELAAKPMDQTELGLRENYDKWNDFSEAGRKADLLRDKRALGRLWTEFDYDALGRQAKVSYRLFEKRCQDAIEEHEWYYYDYPVNQMFGMHTWLVSFLMNMHQIEDVADAQAYIKRLATIDEPIEQVILTMRECEKRGVVPPRFVFDHVLRDCRNILSGAPFSEDESSSSIFTDFLGKLDGLELDTEQKNTLVDEAIKAMSGSMQPAYEALIDELERQQAIATEDDGCWKFPEGAAFYTWSLQQRTTTNLSAAEIHALGLSEVARIHGEMEAIREQVGFEGDLPAFFEHLRVDSKFYYPDTDEGRAAYLAEAKRIVDGMTARLDEFFITKPKAEMIVKAVEPYRERSAGKAFYQSGAPDGSRPGVYYANLYDMGAMPIYQMEALAYHEGTPGHHMQVSIAQELEGIPQFRQHTFHTAYGEGWALYTEHFPKEFGFYEDPYSDFGRLAMQLWRACRLVVDTGLHHLRWTRQEAIDYLMRNTPNPESDCVKAIERYIVMPGQATAYQIGMLRILELRERARTELGDAFSIAEFHDVLLTNGSVPLSMLEEFVDEWIASKKD